MKFIKFILTAIILVFTFVSCSKNFTNLSPNDSILADSAITSVANVRAAIVGLYSGLANTNYYGETAVLIPDLTADNIYRSVQTGARYTAWANGTVVTSDAYAQGTWDQMYSIVINANTIINKAPLLHPSSTAGIAGTDSLELRQLIGEAYAIRALTFFDLTRFFCYSYTKAVNSDSVGIDYGIPIVLQSNAGNLNQILGNRAGSSKYYVPRSTVEQSYAQVMNDIDSALVYLPSNTNGKILVNGIYDPTLFRVRMNYYSVNALAARVCLYKADYANAIKYATVVINNPLYQLLPALTMTTDFHSQNNVESIFEVANNEFNNQGSASIAYEFSQGGYGEMLAPDTLGKIYDSLDVRGPYQGPGGFIYPGNRNAFGGETNTLIINKYNDITNFNENIKVFRLAEMYLIRAEAEGYLTSPSAGYPDLLKVAYARNEIINPNPPTSRPSFDTAILLENRKEFAFEGHRIFDLTRIKNSNTKYASIQGYTYSYYHYKVQKLTSGQLARSGSLTSTLKKYAIMPIPLTDVRDYTADSVKLYQNLDYATPQ